MCQGNYAVALDELRMAEEALDLCDRSVVQGIDNIALLLLDIVWYRYRCAWLVCTTPNDNRCTYQLGDLRALPAAASRLRRARAGLMQSYGADLQQLRVLHGNFSPELATYEWSFVKNHHHTRALISR